jgi:hypothetical protein
MEAPVVPAGLNVPTRVELCSKTAMRRVFSSIKYNAMPEVLG